MTNEEITRQFLLLLSGYWDDPAVHQGFKDLREQVSGQGEWPRIIAARLLALENNATEAIVILEAILSKEPIDYAAALMLACILKKDVRNFRKVLEVLDRILSKGFEGQVLPEWFEAMALSEKAYALTYEIKWDDVLETMNRLLDRFGEAREPFLEMHVAKGLVSGSYMYGKLGKPEEAIRVCEDVERRFGASAESGIQEQMAKALANKGVALGQLGKPEEAIRVYEEVERRFGASAESGIQEQVVRALANKGVVLGQLGKPEEAIRVYEEVERRFGAAMESGIQGVVAMALMYKGWTLGDAKKFTDAVRAYDDVVELFGKSHVMPLRIWVFEAQLRKSLALLEAGQDTEAREFFDSIQNELLRDGEIKTKLASLYTMVARRFAYEMPEGDDSLRQELKKRDLEITSGDPESHLEMIMSHVLEKIDPNTQKLYFESMENAQKRTDRFITEHAHFSDKFSFLLVLREWNSYTPVIPSSEESDRGGGYYIRHAGQGIVIDPGYDFIENFHKAGGRLSGIDHIIVTHAHDDHTAQLEALLMLFQRMRGKKDLQDKLLNLYLSAGVQRKFAGLLDLRDPKYGKVVTLCPSTNQRFRLNDKSVLTVLPAFHDDVITRDSAVGLGFEFDTINGTRRVVFTGDSGCYKQKRGAGGVEMYHDSEKKHPMLDTAQGRALFEQYPEVFRHSPHLVVAHIGSIKEQEFGRGSVPPPGDKSRQYYPNHLGMLGTLMLLNELHPEAAVVSEFGAELKKFHIELVQKLGKALNKFQNEMQPDKKETLVVIGDLTTAYDITNHRFLTHTQVDNAFEFVDLGSLVCRKAKDYLYKPRWEEEVDVSNKVGSERAYLFIKGDGRKGDDYNAKCYAKCFFGRKLPYQIDPVENGDEL